MAQSQTPTTDDETETETETVTLEARGTVLSDLEHDLKERMVFNIKMAAEPGAAPIWARKFGEQARTLRGLLEQRDNAYVTVYEMADHLGGEDR